MTLFPKVKLKVIPTFPSNIIGGVGIETTKQNGAVTVDMDWGEFSVQSVVPSSPTNNVLTFDTATETYVMIPSSLLGGAMAGIADAPINGLQYVRESGNWELPAFIAAGTGATTRTAQDKARDIVSVKDFGAVCDGVTDDLAAINAALAAHDCVWIPQGTTKVSGTIVMARSNQSLLGAGRNLTFLTGTSASDPIIEISGGNFAEVGRMTLDRSATADGTGHGIQQAGTCNQAVIHDIQVGNQFYGLVLSGVFYGTLRDIVAHSNFSDGILISGSSAAGGTLQWNIDNVLSQVNDGDGIRVTSFDSTNMILGEPWRNITTFANSGYGIRLAGTASSFIADINISGGFLGSDGLGGIRLDTFSPAYGVQTTISNIQMEHTGDGPTGRALGTAASHIGSGIEITANNPAVSLTNISINNVSEDGIISAGAMTIITNAIITNSGRKGSGSKRNGIEIVAGSAIITNVAAGNDGTSTQQNGILLGASASGCLVTNNKVSYKSGNAVAGISNSSTGSKIINNIGYNPVGAAVITTTGASPYSYTAGASPEDAWFTSLSSTITGATINGGNILPTGIGGGVVFPVKLGPGDTVVISGHTASTLIHTRFTH